MKKRKFLDFDIVAAEWGESLMGLQVLMKFLTIMASSPDNSDCEKHYLIRTVKKLKKAEKDYLSHLQQEKDGLKRVGSSGKFLQRAVCRSLLIGNKKGAPSSVLTRDLYIGDAVRREVRTKGITQEQAIKNISNDDKRPEYSAVKYMATRNIRTIATKRVRQTK